MLQLLKFFLESSINPLNAFFLFIIMFLFQRQSDLALQNSLLSEKVANSQEAILKMNSSIINNKVDLLLVELQTKKIESVATITGQDSNLFYTGVSVVFCISAILLFLYVVNTPTVDTKLETLYTALHDTVSKQNLVIAENDSKLVHLLSEALEVQRDLTLDLDRKLFAISDLIGQLGDQISKNKGVVDICGKSVDEVAFSITSSPASQVISSLFDGIN